MLHENTLLNKPMLNTERMSGYGPYVVDNKEINYLYGLDDLCKRCLKSGSRVLELGSNDGVSTELFSFYAKEVVAVDINLTEKFIARMGDKTNVLFYHTSFANFLTQNKEQFDLVYIDGDHSYEAVKRDISDFMSRVKPGVGFLAGHDYNSETPGVRKAVLEFFPEERVELFADSSWLVAF